MTPDLVRVWAFFRRLFGDAHVANDLTRVTAAYWAGERVG